MKRYYFILIIAGVIAAGGGAGERERYVLENWLEMTPRRVQGVVWKDPSPDPNERIFIRSYDLVLTTDHIDYGWGCSFADPENEPNSYPRYHLVFRRIWCSEINLNDYAGATR